MKLEKLNEAIEKPPILVALKADIKGALSVESNIQKSMAGLTGEEKRKMMNQLEHARGVTKGLRKAYQKVEMYLHNLDR